jgi:hypothetical protein
MEQEVAVVDSERAQEATFVADPKR